MTGCGRRGRRLRIWYSFLESCVGCVGRDVRGLETIMDLNYLFFIAGMLLSIAVLASRLSVLMGTPLLLLFLGIGMLTGEDGVFMRIVYDDYTSAFYIANLMLALILLDGGLRTSFATMRSVAAESVTLATVGVLLTSFITGLAAYFVLEMSLMQAMLLGAIVGSTDAASVFSLLGDSGVHLKQKVSSTLQIESATNDPMAILLTTVLLAFVSGEASTWQDVVVMFLMQFGLGIVLGIIFGVCASMLLVSVSLGAGLYSLLVIGIGLVGFSVTAALGGSGFLAIFIIGMCVGNQKFRQISYILPVSEGITWLAQITLFLMLGLLVSPTRMVEYVLPGTVVALAITFVARPVAVFLCLKPFFRTYSLRDILFMSWVGLRGSTPIVLAIYPVMDDITNAQLYFNVAFVLVLLSLLLQGGSLMKSARLLKVYAPSSAAPLSKSGMGIMVTDDYEIYSYHVGKGSLAGLPLRGISFPKGTAVAAVFRDGYLIKPEGSTVLKAEDIVSVIGSDADEYMLNSIFSQRKPQRRSPPYTGDLYLQGSARMSDLSSTYGIELTSFEKSMTLSEFMTFHIGGFPQPGDAIGLINVRLVVVELAGDKVTLVGMYRYQNAARNFEPSPSQHKQHPGGEGAFASASATTGGSAAQTAGSASSASAEMDAGETTALLPLKDLPPDDAALLQGPAELQRENRKLAARLDQLSVQLQAQLKLIEQLSAQSAAISRRSAKLAANKQVRLGSVQEPLSQSRGGGQEPAGTSLGSQPSGGGEKPAKQA